MSKIAILDFNFLAMRVWQSLPTKRIPWTRPSEAEEGIHRICEWVYALYIEHKWDRIIFAQDSRPYWRHAWLAEWHKGIKRYSIGDKLYTQYNGALWELIADEGGYSLKAMNAKEEKALTPKLEEVEWGDRPEPSWLKYKGNRSEQKWSCETPQELFYTIREKAAERICRLVKGKQVGFAGAEADDVAACIVDNKNHDYLLLTGDGDWNFLLISRPNVSMHNLYSGIRSQGSDPAVQAALIKALAIKLVGGDSGDNVRGLVRKDHKGRSCVAKDGAIAMLEGKSFADIRPLFEEAYIEKNVKIMGLLPNVTIPAEICEGILESLRYQKVYTTEPMSWDELGLSAKDRERLELNGSASAIFSQWVQPTAKSTEQRL